MLKFAYPTERKVRESEILRMQVEADTFIRHPWTAQDLRNMPNKETYRVYKYTRNQYNTYLKWLALRNKTNNLQLTLNI